MKTSIVVTLQVEGFHRWPLAFEQVAYLRDRHRHIFHIECEKEVFHPDRDVEIIEFKRKVVSYLDGMYRTPCEFGPMSCEDIAIDLMQRFGLDKCTVKEDNENGATVRK